MPKGTPAIQPSQRDDWETPVALFDELWEEAGGFDLDPCCVPTDYTAKRVLENGGKIYVPGTADWKGGRHAIDGLVQPWHGKVYLNPPYGLALRKWVPKAVYEVECGNAEIVVALLPAKTDVQWWQEYVVSNCETYTRPRHKKWYWSGAARRQGGAQEIRFLKGRLQFVGAPDPATFPSAIVVWRR